MQGVLSIGITKSVNMFIFGLFEHCKHDGAAGPTMWSIWRVVLWSLHFLALGIWPTANHNNEPYPAGSIEDLRAGSQLANGMRAVIWLLKGDVEHFSKSYGLRHHASRSLCDFCPADRGAGYLRGAVAFKKKRSVEIQLVFVHRVAASAQLPPFFV